MKIHLVTAKLFRADRQAGRQTDMTKLSNFSQFLRMHLKIDKCQE